MKSKLIPINPRRRSIDIAVDDDHRNPLATFHLDAYPQVNSNGFYFASFPANQYLGISSYSMNLVDDHCPLFGVLFQKEFREVSGNNMSDEELEKSVRKLLKSESQTKMKFAESIHIIAQERLTYLLEGDKKGLDELAGNRILFNPGRFCDDNEFLRDYYIARHCATLCKRQFTTSYSEIEDIVQNRLIEKYTENKYKILESLVSDSKKDEGFDLKLKLLMMKEQASRIKGFKMARFYEFKEAVKQKCKT